MENRVIMSLNDYNALKRKADAFENAVTVNAYSTWVDVTINPRVLKPSVDAAIQFAINEGAIDAERLRMRPTAQWFGTITVAELNPEVEEAPIEHELDE